MAATDEEREGNRAPHDRGPLHNPAGGLLRHLGRPRQAACLVVAGDLPPDVAGEPGTTGRLQAADLAILDAPERLDVSAGRSQLPDAAQVPRPGAYDVARPLGPAHDQRVDHLDEVEHDDLRHHKEQAKG